MTGLAEVLAAHANDGCGDCICSEYVLEESFAAHVEAVVLAWIGERLDGAREDVRWAINGTDPRPMECDVTLSGREADAALAVVRDALGVTR